MLLLGAWLFTTNLPTRLAAATPGYLTVDPEARAHGDDQVRPALARHLEDALQGGRGGRQRADTLKDYGPAPEFSKIAAWINTPGGKPLSLAKLRGKVVLVDFWTYSCVNCIRTLPYLRAWNARYATAGLVIVGVHTPEFAFEHVVGNVKRAVGEHDIRYPVAVDDDYGTWNAYGNQYWPADYLIDRNGPHPRRALRRGRVRGHRVQDPHAARRAGIGTACRAHGRDHGLADGRDPGDLPRGGARHLQPEGLRRRGVRLHARAQALPQRGRAEGHLARSSPRS